MHKRKLEAERDGSILKPLALLHTSWQQKKEEGGSSERTND
jgi:hypothetical protein